MVATQPQQSSNTTQLLRDRVVLITGASRGIGAATAKLLGQHGAAVGVNYYGSENYLIDPDSGFLTYAGSFLQSIQF